MGIGVSKQSRFSCRRGESSDDSAPYIPTFDVGQRRAFKFRNYERRDVPCGSGRAEVTENTLNIFSLYHSESIPLNLIRRYGYESKCFMLETGRRCPSGEATHRIWMEKAEELMSALDQTLAWRRQMLEKELMLEEAASKAKEMKEPQSSSLLQKRAQQNNYVTEPVEKRKKLRKRRERDPDPTTSSDTDSRSDLDRMASVQACSSSAPSSSHGSCRHDSPKCEGSTCSHLSTDLLAKDAGKAPSPCKTPSSHRARLHGESSGESTSSRHRNHRPPRARSRHSNTYKPGNAMTTHFEFQLVDGARIIFDNSSSDVGETDDLSTTSPSTSTHELDSLSAYSEQSLRLDLHMSVGFSAPVSASPSSSSTIVPVSSPCCSTSASTMAVNSRQPSSMGESDSDKTLCGASPSSTEEQYSLYLVSSSASNSSAARTTTLATIESLPTPEHVRAHRCVLDVVDTIDTDSSDSLIRSGSHTPPYPDLEARSCPTTLASSSSVTLCSSATTLHVEIPPEMTEETDSPDTMTAVSSSSLTTDNRELSTARSRSSTSLDVSAGRSPSCTYIRAKRMEGEMLGEPVESLAMPEAEEVPSDENNDVFLEEEVTAM